MTGYKSSHFRWNCNDRGCYYQSLPDWDDLIECFPEGILPTDVDGMVERNDSILFLEEKSAGVGLKEGQRRAFRSLSRRPGITTLFFRPQISEPTTMECLIFGDSPALLDGWEPRDGWKPHYRSDLHKWLRTWCADAESQSDA